MRGGISMVSKRHAKANNPHTADYNPEKENKYIMYYDANNLYGWAMNHHFHTLVSNGLLRMTKRMANLKGKPERV